MTREKSCFIIYCNWVSNKKQIISRLCLWPTLRMLKSYLCKIDCTLGQFNFLKIFCYRIVGCTVDCFHGTEPFFGRPIQRNTFPVSASGPSLQTFRKLLRRWQDPRALRRVQARGPKYFAFSQPRDLHQLEQEEKPTQPWTLPTSDQLRRSERLEWQKEVSWGRQVSRRARSRGSIKKASVERWGSSGFLDDQDHGLWCRQWSTSER